MADVFNKEPISFIDQNEQFPVLNEKVGLTYQQFKTLIENTNYLYKIIGMDKFDGYVGFIYADGTVLFEKFFEVTKNKTTGEEEKRPCKLSNATYKMNIYNFAQFSKLTKQEIIEYIKNIGNEELERFYHSKNWSNNIKKRAEAYSKKSNLDIYNEISSLIDKGDLTKNHI